MKIHFCDLCNESVPQSDIDQGQARVVKGRVVCSSCDRAMSHAAASAGAPAEGAVEAAPVVALATDAPAPYAAPYAAPAPTPTAPFAPSPAHAASGSSSGVWMAALGLGVSAVMIYVFQQRVERLDAADLELARGVEQVQGGQRSADERLGRLPNELAELERRLGASLQESQAANERQRSEFAAASQRAEQSLADLARAISALRKELDSGAVGREQRLDELSHRLAQSEDAQRAMTTRLEDYQKAEAARTEAEALAKALPEKPAAPAAPAWNSLLPNLGDANPSTRWEAVDELGRSKDPAVIPHVTPLLKDTDLFVRMCAARVLADLGTLQGVPALIDALEDGEPTVRESAWNALRTLTGKDFKFDPQGNEADRSKKVKSWRDWWKKEGEGLLNGGGASDPSKPQGAKSAAPKS